MAKKIKSLKGYDIYQDDNGNYIVLAHNSKNDMGPFRSLEEAQKAIEFNKQFSAYRNDSCEVFTKGNKDDSSNIQKELEEAKRDLESYKKSGGERGFGMTPILYREAKKRVDELQKKLKLSKDDDATNELDPQKMMGKKPGSFEDSDPKVAEAQSLINLCGGAM